MDISLKKLEIILRRETRMWKRIREMRGTRKETVTVEFLLAFRNLYSKLMRVARQPSSAMEDFNWRSKCI